MSVCARIVGASEVVVAFGIAAAIAQCARGGTCEPGWASVFGGDDFDGEITASCMYDDGHGPRLHVAGRFESADGVRVNGLARWDGDHWSSLGNGTPGGHINDMTVYDADGPGPARAKLIIAGEFEVIGDLRTRVVASWDGVEWAALGEGPMPPGVRGSIYSIEALDFGEGERLIASVYDGRDVNYIGRMYMWDGAHWTQFAGELYTYALAWDMTVWDPDGVGGAHPSLAMAVDLRDAITQESFLGVALWDGATWTKLAGAPDATFYTTRIAVYDDGEGPAIYTAGRFTDAAGVAAHNIAKWTGTAWAPLGDGLTGTIRGVGSPTVKDLIVFADGLSARGSLYACGDFRLAGSVVSPGIARWDGVAWHAVTSAGPAFENGDANVDFSCLGILEDGVAPARLIASGRFDRIEGITANYVAGWNGVAWSTMGPARSRGLNGPVYALLEHDDGSGPALFAAGRFTLAGATPVNNIARWDGAAWSAVGGGVTGMLASNGQAPALALAEFDEDGPGPLPARLYVGGEFSSAGGQEIRRLARWDGASWSGVGIVGQSSDSRVETLAVYDDDGGGPGAPALYAGGRFRPPGFSPPISGTGRYDGTNWTYIQGQPTLVTQLRVLDDGSGPALYALPDDDLHTYRLIGGVWVDFGFGATGFGVVSDMGAATLPGIGRRLIAGGVGVHLTSTAPETNLLVYEQGAWTPASGFDSSNFEVTSLAVVNEARASGSKVYLVGRDDDRRTLASAWDGQRFSLLGPYSTIQHGPRSTPVLHLSRTNAGQTFVGGDFLSLGGRPAARLARWDGCDALCTGDANGDGRVDSADLFFVLAYFGATAAGGQGAGLADLNHDDRVDFADLNLVLSHFGEAC